MGRMSINSNQCQRGGRRLACRPCPAIATMAPFCPGDMPTGEACVRAPAPWRHARTTTPRWCGKVTPRGWNSPVGVSHRDSAGDGRAGIGRGSGTAGGRPRCGVAVGKCRPGFIGAGGRSASRQTGLVACGVRRKRISLSRCRISGRFQEAAEHRGKDHQISGADASQGQCGTTQEPSAPT